MRKNVYNVLNNRVLNRSVYLLLNAQYSHFYYRTRCPFSLSRVRFFLFLSSLTDFRNTQLSTQDCGTFPTYIVANADVIHSAGKIKYSQFDVDRKTNEITFFKKCATAAFNNAFYRLYG